jgi:hypothetical protein
VETKKDLLNFFGFELSEYSRRGENANLLVTGKTSAGIDLDNLYLAPDL